MEGNNDPFIFGPDASTDMETLHAIHYGNNDNGAYNPTNPHESCYLDAPTTSSDDAVTDWSNLQLSLNGISPPTTTSSQSSVVHDGTIFQEAFLAHHSHVSNLTLAIEGMNNNNAAGLFDAIPASASGSDELNLNPPYIDDKPARMTKQSLRALKDWRAQHGDAARPTKQQVHRLQRRTNLSSEQILNWFNHTKRRAETFGHSHTQQLGTVPQDFSTSNANVNGNAVERPSTPAVRDIIYAPGTPLGDMDPMERWENSPPEHEAALFSDIAKALSNSPLATATVPNKSQTSTRSASHADDSASTRSSINHRDPSTSSLDSVVWSDHSGTSAQSGRSDTKPEYRRRARKRRTNPLSRGLNLNSLRSNNVPKTFQCTFCTDSFKTKYDWSRHEKSLHLALESWTCSPFGAVSHDDENADEEPKCVYCNTGSPTEDHLHTHRYLACDGRPESERTYYRKDHLRQHLRLVHGCRFIPSMEKWKHTPEFVRSRCGFCDKLLSTWQARVDHLAAHFRSGASMAEWVGGWGFEPQISRLIENGIPPFLIHQERNTVAPFTGSIALQQQSKKQPANRVGNNDEGDKAEEEENSKPYINQYSYPATGEGSWYDCFETQLATYINAVIATEGRIPSDKEIQDQGRRFVFDDDDPWHQTIAENVMWLEYFKERHGFNSLIL